MELIHTLTLNQLVEYCREQKLPSFRASQIWDWLYQKRVADWDSMKNIPQAMREKLAAEFCINPVKQGKTEGEPGSTQKVLAELSDGEAVEEVLLIDGPRKTVCISCQAGCAFNCSFCASGQAGFIRNLQAGEMVGQFLLAGRIFNDRISNLVFMGMGEPFDNYEEVIKAARIINDDKGINLGARKITISTCGVVPGIERLADEGIQIELSVSLHAPDNELRTKIMPVNKKYPLEQLLDACKKYTDKTGRIITFEYTLIKDLNDTASHAEALAKLLSPLHSRVNLIPLSEVDEFDGKTSDLQTAEKFVEQLTSSGTNATLRNSRGSTIKAACGQLRYSR